jgi:chloramphenicol 3-O phosphotransferase
MNRKTTAPCLLVLNGISSSGKTTLLRLLQQELPDPYLDAGLDRFLWMLPRHYLDQPFWSEVFHYEYSPPPESQILSIHPGPLGDRLVSGMHRAILALLHSGNHVIADHVLLDRLWLDECAYLFKDENAFLIAVECPIDVVEMRERDRRDRTLGQARAQLPMVHNPGIYDFTASTYPASPQESTRQILDWLATSPKPAAFRKLAALAG